jgi:hypothetical protein
MRDTTCYSTHVSWDNNHKGSASVSSNVGGGVPEELHKLGVVRRPQLARARPFYLLPVAQLLLLLLLQQH